MRYFKLLKDLPGISKGAIVINQNGQYRLMDDSHRTFENDNSGVGWTPRYVQESPTFFIEVFPVFKTRLELGEDAPEEVQNVTVTTEDINAYNDALTYADMPMAAEQSVPY